MFESTIYLASKKMKPFFKLEELEAFIKEYYKPELIRTVQIRNEEIDAAYRIEHDLFVGLVYNEFDELFYIDQDGEAFLTNESKVDAEKMVDKLFTKI